MPPNWENCWSCSRSGIRHGVEWWCRLTELTHGITSRSLICEAGFSGLATLRSFWHSHALRMRDLTTRMRVWWWPRPAAVARRADSLIASSGDVSCHMRACHYRDLRLHDRVASVWWGDLWQWLHDLTACRHVSHNSLACMAACASCHVSFFWWSADVRFIFDRRLGTGFTDRSPWLKQVETTAVHS